MNRIHFIEPFLLPSYKHYANDYVNKIGDGKIHFTEKRKFSWKRLMHQTGVNATTLVEKNFFSMQPNILFFTNSTNLGHTYSMMEEYLSTIPKILIVINAEIEYPKVLREHDRTIVYRDIGSYLSADKIIVHTKAQRDRLCSELINYIPHKILEEIKSKIVVLPILVHDLKKYPYSGKLRGGKPKILWNHRLSSEKNPALFFSTLLKIKQKEKIDFDLYILAEKTPKKYLRELIDALGDSVVHYGFVNSREEYIKILQTCDIVGITSLQDTFCGSIIEAASCGCYPLVPNIDGFPEMFANNGEYMYISTDKKDFYRKMLIILKDIDSYRGRDYHRQIRRWDYRTALPKHKAFLEDFINEFYEEIDKKKIPDSVRKMYKIISDKGCITKRQLFKELGWIKYDYWGRYSRMLETMGISIVEKGNEVYYLAEGIKLKPEDEWKW